ncbi:MAG: hypothetical protein QGH27_07930, partial [SAR324 cluster bacterium]|nr:hypothetical protein [SAR324 cluster bacterium]
MRKHFDKGFSDKSFFYAAPLVLICVFVPFPYSLGAFLMLAGLLVNLLLFGARLTTPVSASLMLCGFVLLVQSACMPLFHIISSRIHEIKLLNQAAYPVIRLLGLEASMSESIIFLPFYSGLSAFPGTLEKTGFYILYLIVIAGSILIILFEREWKALCKFLLICVGYACVRYVFMIFIMAQVNRAEIYWHPAAFTLSYVLLPLILCAVFPIGTTARSLHNCFDAPLVSKRVLILFILFFTGSFCAIGIRGFHDPGNRKDGKILIDEKHSDWEWSSRKFDTTWYGSSSTYNYYCMVNYLNYFYSVEQNHDKKLTKGLLSKYDILVLKTPTQAYEDDEIEDIIGFVKDGGGLWMIGDHTNVFGMDYYLNFIAKRFGIFFHYDSTYDLDSGKLTFYKRPKIFPHPIVQSMPPFLFATSDTVTAPFTAENVITGYGLRSRLLSYSGRSFFEQDPTQ